MTDELLADAEKGLREALEYILRPKFADLRRPPAKLQRMRD